MFGPIIQSSSGSRVARLEFCAARFGASHQMKKANACSPLMVLAEWTGLEPATPGVTGRYSNQLNYHSLILHVKFRWWVLRGSNPRHSPCKGDALPTELSTRCAGRNYFRRLHVLVAYSVGSLPDAA